MRKSRVILAFLMVLLISFTIYSSYAVTWEPSISTTYIHTKVVAYHYDDSSFEEIMPKTVPLEESFEPISLKEGDLINISLFASGDLVNYTYLGEENSGIQSFRLTIYMVSSCGSSIIKEVYTKEDIDTSYFVYKIDDLEPGFYRLEVEAVSKTADYKTTTMKSQDENLDTTFLFTIETPGEFVAHIKTPKRVFLKEGENGEEKAKSAVTNRLLGVTITKDTLLYFTSPNEPISSEIVGVVYFVDSNEETIKTVDIDGFIRLYELMPKGKDSFTLSYAYMYEDGCIGPYLIGNISIITK